MPTLESSKVRLAIIGAGGISGMHARGILQHPGKVECVALCDVSKENLSRRSEQFGSEPRLFSDWGDMLREFATGIDAVLICLPHHLHAKAIFDVIAAGKHILCEKPLCIDLEEADRIVEAVKKAGITFMPAHNQLFMSVMQEARSFLDAGGIGKIRWLRCMESFYNRGIAKDQWRADLKLQGGGELIDTGYHPTYRLLYLAQSEVVNVRAGFGRFQLDIAGEDTASVIVQFASGAIGEIMSSWAFDAPYGSHQIHVIGDKGQLFGSRDALYVLPQGYTEPAKLALKPADTFSEQMSYFADCLLAGKRPLQSVEDSRAVLQVIFKAAEDAAGWEQHAAR